MAFGQKKPAAHGVTQTAVVVVALVVGPGVVGGAVEAVLLAVVKGGGQLPPTQGLAVVGGAVEEANVVVGATAELDECSSVTDVSTMVVSVVSSTVVLVVWCPPASKGVGGVRVTCSTADVTDPSHVLARWCGPGAREFRVGLACRFVERFEGATAVAEIKHPRAQQPG